VVQKLVYSDIYRCTKCGRRVNLVRSAHSVALTFFFSRHSHCIRCGTTNVHRLKKRDRIDSVSRHPVSVLLGLVGAPFNRCNRCRLQYHDWRRPGS
jgi:DNA-directed RNA polymerase subunit RPC12/RpoP